MAFDSSAPAASLPPSSSSPFVSADPLAQSKMGGGVQPGSMLIGRGLGACGGHCCVIRHTFCRPGGTFQLSVATGTAAEG